MVVNSIKREQEKIIHYWKDTKEPGKIDILLLSVLLLVTTVSFLYGDVMVTLEHSFNFLDSVLSGRFLEFYQIAIENSTFGHPAVYEFPIYVIFAIWNLPVYIANKVIGVDYLNSTLCLMWCKLMMIVFTIIAARLVYQIGEQLGFLKERCKWAVFFFLTAATVVIPVFVIVQYDIVSVVFMLLGIKAYMREENKKFILWFMLANTLKLFAVFIFIPLVLLKEKRLIWIGIEVLSGLFGLLICKVIFQGNAAYQASTTGFSDTMIERLQATGINWQYDGFVIPLFVLLMVGVCIFAYAKQTVNLEEKSRFAIYLPLVVFLGFLGLVPFNPYWMILVAPYSVLVIFITPEKLKLNILLDAGIGFAVVWISVMINYPVFSKQLLNPLFLSKVISPDRTTKFTYVREIFISLGLDNMINFCAAFLIACIMAILIINYPRRHHIEMGLNTERIERGVVWIRGAVPCVFAMLLMICYIWPVTGMIYNLIDSNLVDSSVDLLQKDSSVEEKLKFDSDMKISKMEIAFNAEGFEWINSSLVKVAVIDNNNKVMWEESKPVNTFENGIAIFKPGDILLQENQEYTLKITAENGEGVPLYIKYNGNQNQFATFENGEQVEGDLGINIFGEWK